MTPAVILVGALAQIVAWSIVASGRGSVWTTVGTVTALAGVAALAVSAPSLSGGIPLWLAAVAGFAAGLALYLGTRIFLRIVPRWWPTFSRHAETIYGQGGARVGLAAVAAGAVAVGEELFWRGLVQRELAARTDSSAVAAIATLAAYVVTNAASRNLAIVAGAVVGGAVWGALAWWTAGVLASVVAHAAWTTLMLALPIVDEAA